VAWGGVTSRIKLIKVFFVDTNYSTFKICSTKILDLAPSSGSLRLKDTTLLLVSQPTCVG
jgi:hypothetical protein